MTDAAILARRGYAQTARDKARGHVAHRQPVQVHAEATMAALVKSSGNRAAAASALGIGGNAMQKRLRRCATPTGETLREWVDRLWPTAGGPTAVDVLSWDFVGVGYDRERVYVLAAHGDFGPGAHVVRVPASGSRPMARVVCKVCKEARIGS